MRDGGGSSNLCICSLGADTGRRHAWWCPAGGRALIGLLAIVVLLVGCGSSGDQRAGPSYLERKLGINDPGWTTYSPAWKAKLEKISRRLRGEKRREAR